MMRRWMVAFSIVSLLWASSGMAVREPLELGYQGGDNANPHNMSNIGSGRPVMASSTGDVRESQICIFCHTPHGAEPATTLWNRTASLTAFPTYGNTVDILIDDYAATSQYGVDYPNGATKLCLSCHDGATAVGSVLTDGSAISTVPGTITTGAKTFDSGLFGAMSLVETHPVSFVYGAAGASDCTTSPTVCTQINTSGLPNKQNMYRLPADSTYLDGQYRMQCTSCHDPHLDTDMSDGTRGVGSYNLPFWKGFTDTNNENGDYEGVCLQCHVGGSTGVINTRPVHDLNP